MKRTSMEILMIAGLSAALLTTAVQAEETMPMMDLQLGASSLAMVVPDSFVEGDKTDEDVEDGLVAYYYSDETLVDFDVYQWAKASEETLMDAVSEETAEFNNAEIHEKQVDGIDLVYYYANEEYDGTFYDTVTYIAEDGDYFIEIVFWLDGENAEVEADEIIGSLHRMKKYSRR